MKNGMGGWTQWWGPLARGSSARTEYALARVPRNTRSGSEANQSISDIFSAIATNRLQATCKTSGRSAVYGLRGGSIRKKIIGHRMRSISAGFGGGKHVRHSSGTFALFEKPASQHGGSVFLQPLVKQSADFLAEIGGMGQTRQFKTLQGVPRSGEKELPRRLSRARGHRPPIGDAANSNL